MKLHTLPRLLLLASLLMPCGMRAQNKPTTTPKDTTKTTLKERLIEKRDQIKESIQAKIDSLKPKAEEAMIKADSILNVRNAKVTTDTLWVARPLETWTFRAKTDVFSDLMHLRAVDMHDNSSNYYLTADPKVTLGIMANYRGISLSLSFSPSKILSDISDMMSAINYYSNTFGGCHLRENRCFPRTHQPAKQQPQAQQHQHAQLCPVGLLRLQRQAVLPPRRLQQHLGAKAFRRQFLSAGRV